MPIRWAHRDTPGLLLDTASARIGTATRFEQGGRGVGGSLKAAKGIPRRLRVRPVWIVRRRRLGLVARMERHALPTALDGK